MVLHMSNVAVEMNTLVCEEMLSRTRLRCDEDTEFQRVVSVYVAACHGTWSYSQQDGVWTVYCAACGRQCGGGPCGRHSMAGREPCSRRLQQRFQDHSRLYTPICAASERLAHASEVSAMLSRRDSFMMNENVLIQRIQAASAGIRDTVV